MTPTVISQADGDRFRELKLSACSLELGAVVGLARA